MVITAKFSSTCPKCGRDIDAGSKVEWSKGSKASHVQCPASGAARIPVASRKATAEPSIEAAPYVRGEKWEPCRRAALPDTTGEVRVAGAAKRSWAALRKGATGEPAREGEAFVVVAQLSRYESAEDNEDMGDCTGAGWVVTLYLRRATAEEAAPAVARARAERAKREADKLRADRVRELETLCGAGHCASDDAAQLPSGRQVDLDPGVHGSGRKVAVLSEDGGGVAVWCSGYYDDYRQTLAVTRDAAAVAIMLALLSDHEAAS